MDSVYTIGIDYGTASVRAIIVDTSTGLEIGAGEYCYAHGDRGCYYCESDSNVVRQNPLDYLLGLQDSVSKALQQADECDNFTRNKIVGLAVDTTGSSILPLDINGEPLAFSNNYSNNINSYIWLWKDHSASEEANIITKKCSENGSDYLKIVGNVYSSEWFWAKVLRCLNVDESVFNAAYTWVEAVDWLPFVLSANRDVKNIKRCVCAAGHKALYNAQNGGYPREFINSIDSRLDKVLQTHKDRVYSVGEIVGVLDSVWANKWNLPSGIPISAGAFDAHYGGIGGGVCPGVLVKTVGTSSCDLTIVPSDNKIEVEGLSGAIQDSIVPGYLGIEAGQSAVGDLYNWYIKHIGGTFSEIEKKASNILPGSSGLLFLDWSNGNRTVLNDQLLSGCTVGLTLTTQEHEIYRAIIEGTAFGAKAIVDQMNVNGIPIKRMITCGGISVKSELVMQIYADILDMEIAISNRRYTCALGAAIGAAVAAGVYPDIRIAIKHMTGCKEKKYYPIAENRDIYKELYALYMNLHDAFGRDKSINIYHIMKDLLKIKTQVFNKTEVMVGA